MSVYVAVLFVFLSNGTGDIIASDPYNKPEECLQSLELAIGKVEKIKEVETYYGECIQVKQKGTV